MKIKMLTVARKTRYLFGIIFMSVSLSACGLSGGPLSGKIIDEVTGEPIAGAIVVARWVGSSFALVERQTTCVHVETAITNENGRYFIAPWMSLSNHMISGQEVYINAYKLGYGRPSKVAENVDYLKPFYGTREERLKYLLHRSGLVSCGSKDGSEKNIIPMLKALYKEAVEIAVTKADKKKTEFILYKLEIQEIGFEEAGKRHWKRAR